jgi:AcrR family transcriptional regulator
MASIASLKTKRSPPAGQDRRARRRRETIEEALDHAVAIMGEQGVGGLTISEMARRVGVKAPSLYKYFPSLHAVYDALFARGLASSDAAVQAAITAPPSGLMRIRAGTRAVVRWCVDNPALAQLLYWRAVPGFEPSPETFAASARGMEQLRAELAEAVRRGELHPRADSDDAVRMLTILMSGLFTQQMANQPGVAYDNGLFTRRTDDALDMFIVYYDARRNDADPRP